MRSHPPSAQPNIENTKRTHSARQPEQNTAASTPPTNPQNRDSHRISGAVCRKYGDCTWFAPRHTPPSLPIPWYPYSPQPPAAGDIVITRGGRPTRPDNLSMPLTRSLLLACCTAGLIFAQPAPQKQLTARELFYAAAPAPAAVKRSEEHTV